ncbi:hypothetical protein ANN_09489 [Periplaneta americana]|uniref:DUF4371 domain-containing protein n=1 Tax=Periplaneta americana TaxID=6978 RepID=A0ABQ8TP11_PERAM|nr:hypothetical protein ANN_09489 [Periplaneta americana]
MPWRIVSVLEGSSGSRKRKRMTETRRKEEYEASDAVEEEISKIPLSDNTVSRRIKEMSYDIEINVNRKLVGDTVFALQLDENHDTSGVTITDDGRNHVEMKERLKKGKYAISTLNQVLWDNKIRIETKHKIYKSIVRSTTLYRAETWQLQNAFKNKFLALEMDYWRRSAGISRRDRIRNDIIREKMQVKNDIVEDIFTKQLICYGHMMRMNTERLPRLAYDWTPSRRRKRGRPMTTWKKGIVEAMERRQLGEDLWRDRGEWAHHIQDMTAYVKEELNCRLRSCQFALQIDKSSDVADLAVVLVFVCCHYEDAIEEDILLCKPLPANATGSEIFRFVIEYLEENHIPWDNHIHVCTDGAKAMVGKKKKKTADALSRINEVIAAPPPPPPPPETQSRKELSR